jgi:hypothetical protein
LTPPTLLEMAIFQQLPGFADNCSELRQLR